MCIYYHRLGFVVLARTLCCVGYTVYVIVMRDVSGGLSIGAFVVGCLDDGAMLLVEKAIAPIEILLDSFYRRSIFEASNSYDRSLGLFEGLIC